MTERAAVIVADGDAAAGLGHIARSSALSVALGRLGFSVRCFALAATASTELDAVVWQPVSSLDEALRLAEPTVLVLDSYRLDWASVDVVPKEVPIVVMQEHVEAPPRAALVVSVGADAALTGPRRLCGPEYACLRPAFWQPVERVVPNRIRRVLVTTGAGDAVAGLGPRLAAAAREALPDAAVVLVRGPYGTGVAPAGVELIVAPESLYAELVAADTVITAAGQTLLEAAATGAPMVAVIAAENQRRQAERLAVAGAARTLELPGDELQSILCELDVAPEVRLKLARAAQSHVDGRGARRVAERIAELGGAAV